MADTFTERLGLTKPEIGASRNTWGLKWHGVLDALDELWDIIDGHKHTGEGTNGPQLPPAAFAGLDTDARGFLVATSATETAAIEVHTATEKTDPLDADELLMADSAAGYALVRVLRSNLLKAALLAGNPYNYTAHGAQTGALALPVGTTVHSATAVGNITLSITGTITVGKAYLVILELTNGGAFAITDPTGTKWPGGVRPTLSPAGRDKLFYLSHDGGTTWDGSAQIDIR